MKTWFYSMVAILFVAGGCGEHGLSADFGQQESVWSESDSSLSSDSDTSSTFTTRDSESDDLVDTDSAVCGNGILEKGEFCDDGDTDDGDGCDGDCLSQDPDYNCAVAGQSCTLASICGNGVLEASEVCDEGEANETAGCALDCTLITDGWVCPKPGAPCVEEPVCGDGVRARGEQCDDGDTDDGDGCDVLCAQETGYFCIPGQPCIEETCGNGVRTPDEACDDGDTDDDDGCDAACVVEDGYRCSSLGCTPVCGDGILLAVEECDDGNRVSGDGCNVQCVEEPYYSCTSDSPSICTTTTSCGNGVVEPGEICDPGKLGHETCFATGASACNGFENDLVDDPVCGNSTIEYQEACDGDGGTGGCTDDCELETGYACPVADYCYWIPVCGDGVVQAGEACDVGAVSSLACDGCAVQGGWYCSGSPSDCVASVCQDGQRAPDEQCDDGNDETGDGCDAACDVETGWICPPGIDCITDCGNGVLEGTEACDDGNGTADDGCTQCTIDAGYDCDTDGCHVTVCGDSLHENGEGCDDGNLIAGDGCGPTCQLEPTIVVGPSPTVAVVCGDGLVTSGEGCDDGNTSNGDGCDALCNVESGWTCAGLAEYPDSLEIKVTYRDFMQETRDGGHPHFRNRDNSQIETGTDHGMVGAVCDTTNTATCGRLDSAGKPVLDTSSTDHETIYASASPTPAEISYNVDAFALWYRDTNTTVMDQAGTTLIDVRVNPTPMPTAGVDTLLLNRDGTTTAYDFESDGNLFYPLGTTRSTNPVVMRGHGCTFDTNDVGCDGFGGEQRNYHFTSELRYFFQYQGGETLTFFGDDDVWVFVNGRLAVDIGGIHSTQWGRVILGDDGAGTPANDSNCTVAGGGSLGGCALNAAEAADDNDLRFGLVKGEVYEIVVFQAERQITGSNYRLTLDGFIAPRSHCSTDCGDDIVAGTELCDDGLGNTDGQYGVCNTSCSFTYCGDGITQSGDEDCDDGLNIDSPWAADQSAAEASCTGCQIPGYCGDGILQSGFEVCDDGANDGSYGGCASDCQSLSGYCGDGAVENDEESCDDGSGAFVVYKADGTGCGYDCEPAAHCGDGLRNGPEQCDGSVGCAADCQFVPYCGDGLVATDNSEQCDYGDFAFDPADGVVYGGCSTACELGPYCGDGDHYVAIEECDDGGANSDSLYGGCTLSCTLGPRCGDGMVQDEQGEACDNGYNEDTYLYVGDACGANCTAVPYCGDGTVQQEFEWCDHGDDNNDNLYNGCTTSCEWGAYCGDGILQTPEEACDLGSGNAAYSATPGGCGYDCQPAPYCGDGIRNGTEQCDGGTDGNLGGYGGCNVDCTNGPYCGDHVIDEEDDEECDDGPIGSLSCSVDCKDRTIVL